MKYQPACIDCSKRQGIRVYHLALNSLGKGAKDRRVEELRRDLEENIHRADPALSPAELSLIAIRTAGRFTASDDPFLELKRRTNELFLSLYPELKERIAHSENPLFLACQLAACGNIIDLGIQDQSAFIQAIPKILLLLSINPNHL